MPMRTSSKHGSTTSRENRTHASNHPLFLLVRAHTHTHTHTHIQSLYFEQMQFLKATPQGACTKEKSFDSRARAHTHTHTHTHTSRSTLNKCHFQKATSQSLCTKEKRFDSQTVSRCLAFHTLVSSQCMSSVKQAMRCTVTQPVPKIELLLGSTKCLFHTGCATDCVFQCGIFRHSQIWTQGRTHPV